MSEWDAFRESLKNALYKKIVPKNPENTMDEGKTGKYGDFGGDSLKVSKNEYGNALLSTLDLRNVRPWSEGRYSPRRAQKPPGPQATAAPEAAKSDNGLTVETGDQGEPGEQPAPVSMRWILTPCLLVPIALELDASGVLTWQAGQFDDNVRALCEEHGPRIRAFLSTLPGHRWESWQENALEAADRWETGQGARQREQWHD